MDTFEHARADFDRFVAHFRGSDGSLPFALAAKFAILGSSSTDKLTSTAEAQGLLDTLFACDNSEVTPSGRRIVAIISIEDIDKLF